jgi:diguanylate cyclase (GGDEF)-like protein
MLTVLIDRAKSAFAWALRNGRQIRPIYAAIIGIAVAIQALIAQLDTFEWLYEFSRAHEDWQLDEWFMSFAVLTLVFLSVAIVRSGDLKREARRRMVAEMRLSIAIKHMRQGLAMFDGEQRLVICNDRYADMYGLPPHFVEQGATLQQVLQARTPVARPAGTIADEHYRELATLVQDKEAWTQIRELADGRAIYVAHDPLPDGGWVSTHEDITERRQIEARLAHLAHHDALTDLANRVLLREELDRALARVKRGESLALLCIDLDHFKEINDTLGHPTGDAFLQRVADRLRGCVRETDVVARMGGDEFAIMQLAANQPTDATVLASRVIENLTAQPIEISGHDLTAGASIGIAMAPLDGADADQLLRSADLALYQAKIEGRGGYRFFEPQMNERMQARRKLEADLKKALAAGEFELYYQPLLDLKRNEIEGFEALLRWHHPERGMISPADFIPLAEETGLIVPIGEWVLREACAEAALWQNHICVSVNLSPVQFKNPGLVPAVVRALAASGLEAARLELEITETVLLQDNEATLATLHKLRSLGARIALDDFGTGYSSLGYLQSFPFDKIKIDRSFIKGLGEGTNSLAILRAVASLGANLGMATTAEGVETEEQFAKVKAEGITHVQGYLVGRPRPAQEITMPTTSTQRTQVGTMQRVAAT